jgi:uncharacterized protein (UPF0335 family)
MDVDGKRIRAIVEHHEALEADKKTAAEDQAQLLADAEDDGLDKAALKRLIRRLRKDAAEVREQEEADAAYLAAYMNFDNSPLGAYAAKYIDPKDAAKAASFVDEFADHIARKAEAGTVVDGLGTAVEVSDDERDAGVVARFDDGRGGTATISTGEIHRIRDRCAADLGGRTAK